MPVAELFIPVVITLPRCSTDRVEISGSRPGSDRRIG
jgi:hypothetical protein